MSLEIGGSSLNWFWTLVVFLAFAVLFDLIAILGVVIFKSIVNNISDLRNEEFKGGTFAKAILPLLGAVPALMGFGLGLEKQAIGKACKEKWEEGQSKGK